jgi:hypothetical protein
MMASIPFFADQPLNLVKGSRSSLFICTSHLLYLNIGDLRMQLKSDLPERAAETLGLA